VGELLALRWRNLALDKGSLIVIKTAYKLGKCHKKEPKVVSGRLGHANISIALDIYSHVLPGMQEAAAERFDKTFEVDNNGNSEPNVK